MSALLASWSDRIGHALSGGRVVDWVILMLAAELLLLLAWHVRTGRGLPAFLLLPNLAAGLCLMLALRSVLAGHGPAWTAAALLGSGLAHALDLRQRLRHARGSH